MLKNVEHRAERAPRDFSDQIDAMRRTDGLGSREVVLRRCVVVLGGMALWLTLYQPLMVAWGFGYVLLDMLYLWSLRTTDGPVYLLGYLKPFALNLATSVWICGMIVYIASFGTIITLYISCCGVAGLALNALLTHDEWGHGAYINITNTAIASLGVSINLAMIAGNTGAAFGVIVLSLALLVYFLSGFIEITKTRERLQARHTSEAQAAKMQAVGQLTAGVAHDFNNLLTVIRGNMELLQTSDDPADRQALISDAIDGSDRAAHLVRQLLAFSRKSPLSPSEIALDDFLRNCQTILVRLVPSVIRVKRIACASDSMFQADAAMLNTAILNAALNAVDAMLPEGGSLTLSAEHRPGEIAIKVEDTGPGVPEAFLDQIEEPFFTTKPAGSGSGLGLSMIKGFAEQSGGHLELNNRQEGGFCVTIVLPCADDAKAQSGAA